MQNPFLQGLHCMWSLGSTLGPLMTQPFLLPLSTPSNSSSSNSTDLSLADNVTMTEATEQGLAIVRFAYVCVGSVSLLAGLLFLLLYLLSGCHLLEETYLDNSEHCSQDQSAETKVFRIKLLTLMCFFYFLYVGYEGTTGKFISSFVTKYLDWDVKSAAMITAAFWAAVGAGRFINIFVAAILRPRMMLLMNFRLTSSKARVPLLLSR